MSADTEEVRAEDNVEETELLDREDEVVEVSVEEDLDQEVIGFEYNPPSERAVLGKVSSYGEEVAEAVRMQKGVFSAYDIVGTEDTRVSENWAKDILEEMEDAGMVEKKDSAKLLDKNSGTYVANVFTATDVEEFVEAYREALSYV